MTRPQPFRLATGGRTIDRSVLTEFTFNGRACAGYRGDTLASALLANGIRVVARSFKFHRPRGVMSAGPEEPNALLRVEVGGVSIPLVRATLQPLVEGLRAESEHCYPSVDFDFGRVIDFTHRLWPAGFYHKVFKWPGWHWYEGLIRRATGLGRLPEGRRKDGYHHHNLHCDVLVCGGGPGGLSAAYAASRSGARVVLIEQDSVLGGRLLAERLDSDLAASSNWLGSIASELERAANVRILLRTTVSGYYDHNVLTALDRSNADDESGPVERFWTLRAREVILATGAIEQPLVFANNDRPGVMLAGAGRCYVNRYAVAPGRALVVATNNDDAYRTAFDAHDAGIGVVAIVDARASPSATAAEGARARQLSVVANSVITNTRGAKSLRQVSVRGLAADGRSTVGPERRFDCDLLTVSGDWSPTLQLFRQAGGSVRYAREICGFVPESCRQRVHVVGAANGDFSLKRAIERGGEAGTEAARRAAVERRVASPASVTADRPANDLRSLRRTPGGPSARQWIDFSHDVTTADVELAVRENYVSVEHLKRYTTVGMATDQGKTSNLNALELLADLTGQAVSDVGATTARPPFTPITLGAVAGGASGELYAPARLMPGYSWHVANGASFEDYGAWKRPAYYPRGTEDRERAMHREVLAVRNGVGLFEGSPLGKIEVRGPDAAEFLNRMYINNVLSLRHGQVRYGIMLNENGIVIDDGVFARLADEHYLISTTSAGAERITAWLEEWHQCEWPDLRMVLLPVTSQWAVLTVAGPHARTLLQALESDIDFSPAAFPHMTVSVGRLAGMQARVQRVSYCGELSFEVSVPANRAEELCTRLSDAGRNFGLQPIGIEAWLVLRLEKGFPHLGSDTDGTTNAFDLGFRATVERKRTDFVGRRSLLRAVDRADSRRQFVGLEQTGDDGHLKPGAHFVTGRGSTQRSEGFVTSACFSPTLGKSIGLGLLERGFARKGEVVDVFDDGRRFRARVVNPGFYDPTGNRMNG